MSFRRILGLGLASTAFILGSAFADPALASRPAQPTSRATATASSAPSAEATTAASPTVDRAKRVHQGVVTCIAAPFYSWPDRSSVPTGTAYPAAREGDAFAVIGDGTLATNGMTLYETTIEIFSPYGVGKHFYIDATCINAG